MTEPIVTEKVIIEVLESMPAVYVTAVRKIVALYNETLTAMSHGQDWVEPYTLYQQAEELLSRESMIPLPAVKQICAFVFGEPSQTNA